MLALTPIEETVAGQDLIKKGKQEGLQQGLQEGLQQGLQQGLKQGEQQTIQNSIVDLLEIRFGTVPDDLIETIEVIDNLPRLRTLLRQTVRVASLTEFTDLLTGNKAERSS